MRRIIMLFKELTEQIKVYYFGSEVGEYYADLIVERKVIVELKAAKKITPQRTIQLVNYLKATDAQVGLVLNFGTEPEIARRIVSNERKKHRPKKPLKIDDDPSHP